MSAKLLHPFHISANYKLAHVGPRPDIHIDSPASVLMLDFRLHPVLALPGDTPLDETQHTLGNSHGSAVLVVDSSGEFCGVITRGALSGQAIMQKVGKGRRREDLQARDFMVRRERLTAVELGEIENSTVGKVIGLLRDEGASIVLVVDDPKKEVVGLLSAEEIEQVLNLELAISHNPTFLEIFDAVMHS